MFTIDQFIENQTDALFDRAGTEVMDPSALSGTAGAQWDAGLRRPYLAKNGQAYVDVTTGFEEQKDANGVAVRNNVGDAIYGRVVEPQKVADRMRHGMPVMHVDNATTLTKDQWIRIDTVVMKAARRRQRAWSDLRAANTFGGFDGMTTPILEYEAVNDPGEAVVDMEGLAEGRNFAPKFERRGLPLPITHSDFHLSERFLAVSRSKGQAQDLPRAEMAAERVAEVIEQTLIGTTTGITYGADNYLDASTVYGYTNFPPRTTKTDLTAPSATNGTTILSDVLAMLEDSYANNFYGPFVLYTSTNYDAVLDNDLKANSDKSVRQRLREIDNITDIRRLDYLTGDVLIMVQMTADVAEAVNGAEITTVQWDTKGGMQRNFKVMGIQVPRLRAVYESGTDNQVAGIVHATTS